MKHVTLYVLSLVLCFALLSVLPIQGEEGIYDNVVRLHILANSDRAEDQALKLAVRDGILAEYSEAFNCESREDAAARVEELLPSIQKSAQKIVADHNSNTPVTVAFTREAYPERVYGDLHFPAGTYHSLRIVIGDGDGQNWWCVLFPPLCLSAATEETVPPDTEAPHPTLTDNQWSIISRDGAYEIRFRILEMLFG